MADLGSDMPRVACLPVSLFSLLGKPNTVRE
jgi:hypothetical protein